MRISDWSSDVCSSDLPSLAKIGVFSLPCSVSLSPKCIVGRGSMRIEKAALKRSPQKTIAAILAAANHEFGQHGLEGASMENIARRCGKTKQLIYHYYGSKELL